MDQALIDFERGADLHGADLRRAGPLSTAALAALAYDLYHGWAHTCPDVLINGEPSDINVPWGHACRYCGAQPAGLDAAREG